MFSNSSNFFQGLQIRYVTNGLYFSGYKDTIYKPRTVTTKIGNLLEKKNSSSKNKSREAFIAKCKNTLFDIGVQKTINAVKSDKNLKPQQKKEEIAFLKQQNGSSTKKCKRQLFIGTPDLESKRKYKEDSRKEQQRSDQKKREIERVEKENIRKEENEYVMWSDIEMEELGDIYECKSDSEDEDFICEQTNSNSHFTISGEHSIDTLIEKTSALALSNNISENSHYLMTCGFLSALNVNIEDLKLSRTHFRSVRHEAIMKQGEDITASVKEKLKNSLCQIFVDGKKITHRDKNQREVTSERLTISMKIIKTNACVKNTRTSEDILLKIIPLQSATGKSMADGVYQVCI